MNLYENYTELGSNRHLNVKDTNRLHPTSYIGILTILYLKTIKKYACEKNLYKIINKLTLEERYRIFILANFGFI